MKYYVLALKKYAVFNGRASRSEYWYFFLFNIIIAFFLGVIEGFLGIAPGSEESVLYSIYQIFIFTPSLAVGVRRLHDVNKSGWFILVPIYNLILLISKGDEGNNKYGDKLSNNGINRKFCIHCGHPTEFDAKFCVSCGNKFI